MLFDDNIALFQAADMESHADIAGILHPSKNMLFLEY
jgi:hypothetical protein